MNKIIVITMTMLLSSSALAQAIVVPDKVPNWCKGRAQSDCTAVFACSWRETITDGNSKTACVYNAKAAKALVAEQLGVVPFLNKPVQ